MPKINPRSVERKEAVNHPSHYQSTGGIEVIDVIESLDIQRNVLKLKGGAN